MSMKHRLRRAFRHTAPNVLGSVLQDLPELQKTVQTAPPEKKRLPHWFTELAATAAALALLLGVISGTIWFVRNNFENSALSNLPADTKALAQDALSIVCPDGEEPGYKADIEATGSADALCRIVIHYKGYNYDFTYRGGVLEAIEFPLCDCFKEGYLSETAVQQSILLLAQQKSGNASYYLEDFQQYDSVYHLTFLSKTYFSFTDYYVHAKTGEVLWPSDSMQLEKAARSAALGHIGKLLSNVYYLSVEYIDDDTHDCAVTVTTEGVTHEFRVTITGEIAVYTYTPCETLPDDFVLSSVIGWQKARDIALEYAGLTLEELIGFEYGFDTNGYTYTLQLLGTQSGTPHIIQVDGLTGAIIPDATPPVADAYITEDQAMAFAQQAAGEPSTVVSARLITRTDDNAYYIIVLNGKTVDWSKTYYVNAATGEVTDTLSDDIVLPTPPDGLIGEELAIETALEKAGITMEQAENLTCVLDKSVQTSFNCYIVSFVSDGFRHRILVAAYSLTVCSYTKNALAEEGTPEYFNTLFSDLSSWYNRALTSLYASPAEIKVKNLFYLGFSGERILTLEEWIALKDYPQINGDIDFRRLSPEKMNTVLEAYFGITVEDINSDRFEGLIYLESTGCYYFTASDVLAAELLTVTAAETLDNGNIQVYYTCGNYTHPCVVTLRPTDSGYIILSNLPA